MPTILDDPFHAIPDLIRAHGAQQPQHAALGRNGEDSEMFGSVNTSNKRPFQLPVRRVVDGSTRTDSSLHWQSVK